MTVPGCITAGLLGSAAPVSVNYEGTAAYNSSMTGSHTFAGMAIGTAASNRRVLAAVVAQMSGTTDDITGVTIGGVTATKIGGTASANISNKQIVEFWTAIVPTGTTADVVISFSGTFDRIAANTYSGKFSATVYDHLEVGNNAATSISGTINVRAGGAVVGAAIFNLSDSITWTGITSDVDTNTSFGEQYSAAHDIFAAADAGRTIQASISGSLSTFAMGAVSLSP